MPALLIVAVVVMVLALLALVLLPVSLWARYRSGRARRRAQGWVVRINAWLFALSMPVFVLSAWIASFWLPQALRDALLGVLAGIAFGGLGLWATRFEYDVEGFHFTPNRWVVLALVAIVAARIAAGLWLSIAALRGGAAPFDATWLRGGGWLGIAGLLLGYHGSYAWGLRARLPVRAPR